jgi:thermostable 8-oxoguanine DNA glycosylase
MIDPDKLTNYSRTEVQLQELWLFSIAVAGKPAFRIARQVSLFIRALPGGPLFGDLLPFDRLKKILRAEGYDGLFAHVLDARFGQHTRIAKAFAQSVDLDLRAATLDELMTVHGVGPKTARMFLLHSRRNQRLAVLDTHILKFLKTKRIKVPKITPTGRKYLKLETKFLALADKAKVSPAKFDLDIWRGYADRGALND